MDAAALLTLLERRAATLATAESLTGGLLGAGITRVPGASRVYLGGVVAYATEVKRRLLGIEQDLVDQYGVVSAECARAMADGVRQLLGSTYGLSTTGVAGPQSQEGRPVGTVFVGVAGPGLLTAVALELNGDRDRVRERTCGEALSALGGILRREEPGLR